MLHLSDETGVVPQSNDFGKNLSMSNSRTRKKRNRWDSDGEGNNGHLLSQVDTGSSEYSGALTCLLEQPKQLEAAGTTMEQLQASVGCDNHCYHYSPLLQGCRNMADCYERLDVIAEGTYGIVWKASDKNSQEIVALKQIKDVGTKEGFPILALREMQSLLDLSHDCIVSIREVVVGEDLDKVFMVFPVRT
jgi:cell division cycle 2-like protein